MSGEESRNIASGPLFAQWPVSIIFKRFSDRPFKAVGSALERIADHP